MARASEIVSGFSLQRFKSSVPFFVPDDLNLGHQMHEELEILSLYTPKHRIELPFFHGEKEQEAAPPGWISPIGTDSLDFYEYRLIYSVFHSTIRIKTQGIPHLEGLASGIPGRDRHGKKVV
jgi:hypothetical protein